MPASVLPPAPYNVIEAFNGLSFELPVAAVSPPGDSNRLFVVERTGRIVVITNLANPTRAIFLDISPLVYSDWENGKVEGLSSVAFHPGYLTNRFPLLYLSYTMRTNGPLGLANYNRVSRFQATRALPNEAVPTSELPLITQIDHGDGHNINDLAFGPDGYLYIAIGDEGDGGTGDDFNNAQRIDKNFFSGILRIDVDQRPDNLPPNPHPASSAHYSIPADNPWVGATNFNSKPVDPAQVRTEFYAVGLRNPWRMAFDPLTSDLWAGDVGQHGREEINLIVKGGNYGWSLMEGSLRGPKGPPPAGLQLEAPIHEYSPGYGPDQGFSVIGGMVYRGPRLPELLGAYVFADYVTGNIWALRRASNGVATVERLGAHGGIAGFAEDPRDGELLLIDHHGGKILMLARTDPPVDAGLPPTLADTGAFADLPTLSPYPGIVPYTVNVPFWSDGAEKKRWFSVPDPHQTIGFDPEQNWTFPQGTVWVKHFELTNAVGGSPRRLETRLLVKSPDGVYGATYRWGESTTNAFLVPAEGLDEEILVADGGLVRTQVWHYPSRNECLTCHTPVAGYALGFNTAQLNRAPDDTTNAVNQIRALTQAGYFLSPPNSFHPLPALSSLTDPQVSREFRVHSYLTANCVQCHQPGGAAYGLWDARLTTPLHQAGVIDGALYNNRGDTNNRVIQPGSLQYSMLFSRISQLGRDHMPPLGTSVIDETAVQLLRDWITLDLPADQSFTNWQIRFFGSTNAPTATPSADPDGDGASNQFEYLLGSNPLDPADVWKLQIQRTAQFIEISYPQIANRAFEIQMATGFSSTVLWQPLDLLENRRFFSATNRLSTIRQPVTDDVARFYRVRIREP